MLRRALAIALLTSLAIPGPTAADGPRGKIRDIAMSDEAKQRVVALIERSIAMPAGTEPLAQHVRYYSFVRKSGEDFVYATYVHHTLNLPASAHPRVVLTPLDKHVSVFDGGCSVVTAWYSLTHRRFVIVACNGIA